MRISGWNGRLPVSVDEDERTETAPDPTLWHERRTHHLREFDNN